MQRFSSSHISLARAGLSLAMTSIATLSVISLTACGPASLKKQNDVLPDFPGDADYAANYFVQDTGCQSGQGAASITTASFFEYNGRDSVSKNADLTNVTSTTSLSSSLIKSSMYGLYQQSKCEFDGNKINCAKDSTLVREATLLKVCQTSASYDRNAVEGIALSGLANLEHAFTFYGALAQRNPAMMRTTLLVLPKVERQIVVKAGRRTGETVTTVMTDNLAYTPEFIGEPAFVIYPKGNSKIEGQRWLDLNLWEIPFALAHEFGHHIMRTHTGVINGFESKAAAGEFTLNSEPILPAYGRTGKKGDLDRMDRMDQNGQVVTNDGIASESTRAVGFSLLQRTVSAKDIWGSVNEGFADLFRYYSTGALPKNLSRVECFAQSREIDSAIFFDGTPKVMGAEVLKTFNSTTVTDAPEDCGAPYFQGIHSMGAIIAHGVDRMYLAAGFTDAAARANLTLAWAGELKSIVARQKASEITLAGLVGAALKPLTVSGRAVPAAVCDVARQIFPAFSDSWFNSGAYECQ